MNRIATFVTITAILTLAAASASAQGWATAEPLYGTHTINTGFMPDPVGVSVVAGGVDDPATALGAPTCTGMITAAQPDVRVNFSAGTFPLNFLVNSEADTTLVVNAPDGTWHCNDDSHSLDPMVGFAAPQSGQYDIWVGIWGQAATAPAVLLVTEMNPAPITCDANAQTLAGDPGAFHFVTCPAGCAAGSAWGTGTYSDDSSVCTAAVHAGVIPAGHGGALSVTIAAGLEAYPASVANGVSSSQWGSWGRSFTVANGLNAATSLDCSVNAQSLAGDPGAAHRVACPAGCTTSSVWGTGVYSDDSSVCTAAVHAGVITAAGGEVTVTIAPGQPAYPASNANGVSSSEWGSWGRSFVVTP